MIHPYTTTTGCAARLKKSLCAIAALLVALFALPQQAQAQSKEAYVVEEGSTLTFCYDANKAARTGTLYGIDEKRDEYLGIPVWAGIRTDYNVRTTKVVFESSFKDYRPTDLRYWFFHCPKIEVIEGLRNLNTEQVTIMRFMFLGCESLTSLDLSSFNTANVTDMNSMFEGCTAMLSVDVSSFNTAKVTDMSYLFNECGALTSLDLTNFNTKNVTCMDFMFSSCVNLRTIYCNDTWTCESSDHMFLNCYDLKGAAAYIWNKTGVSMANPETGYFTKKGSSGIETPIADVPAARRGIYTLNGVRLNTSPDNLPAGIYLIDGRKVVKR